MNQKSTRYAPLRMQSNYILKNLYRIGMSKTDGLDSFWRDSLLRDPSSANSLEYMACATERYWQQVDMRQAIFPSDLGVIEGLLNAKFDLKPGAQLTFPIDTFALFMPKGLKLAGQAAATCMVQIMTYRQRHEIASKYQKDITGLPGFNSKLVGAMPDDQAIFIFYSMLDTPEEINSITVSTDKLMHLLSISETTAFKEAIGFIGPRGNCDFHTIENTEAESAYQQQLLKLITAIFIYNSATKGKRLTVGAPGIIANKLTDKNVKTISYKLTGKGSSTNSHHVRGMHFRNLSHEKYYRGEYKDLKPSSRWIFIDQMDVGLKSMSLS